MEAIRIASGRSKYGMDRVKVTICD